MRLIAALALLTLAACGGRMMMGPSNIGGNGVPGFPVAPPPGAIAQFTVSPVDVSIPNSLTALGNLSPPGHTIPSDHVYFYQANLALNQPFGNATRQVRAPATGTVLQILPNNQGEAKVVFIVTPTFQYYLDHLVMRPGLAVGQVVNAGDILGTASTTLDLGAFDYTTRLTGYATPSRYGDQTIHCVSPWKYFVEPLRSQLYSFVYRAPNAPDRDGKIDLDVPGRLAGAWYDPSVPPGGGDATWGPPSWPKSMDFAYDYYDPSQVRISIGGTIGEPGVWAIEPSAPRPADVSVADGKVVYKLMSPYDRGIQWGVMVVQMISDTSIKIEVFQGFSLATADFDGNAFTWVR